jgi:hypothetical protein
LLSLSFFRTCLIVVATGIFLAACGGGGGGGNSVSSIAPAVPWVAPTGPAASVTGVLSYERVAQSNNGALDYANITVLPIRGATVELIYQGRPIASTQSSATGHYSFDAAPAGNAYSVRIRAELKQASNQWDVTVRDNTAGNALYALESSNFNVSTAGALRDVTAGSGWVGSPTSGSYALPRAAGPFALLDTIYASQQKVLLVQTNIVFPSLQVYWSVNNNTAVNNFSLGDIGGSFFQTIRDSQGSITTRAMYILGRENNDTDEYDSSVVAHEWGHYYQSAFSRDDSMGGAHSTGDDRLDRRIAFSEGWGNAWSGMVTGKLNYGDSQGIRQSANSFAFPLNSGYSPSNAATNPKGWFREASIQYILWDLHRQEGFGNIHSALTSSAFKNGSALTDIHSFSHAYRGLNGVSANAFNALLTSESIAIATDAFGTNESNAGGSTTALPYYRQITSTGDPVTLAQGQSLCTNANYTRIKNSSQPSDGDRNKLGYFVYAKFTPAVGARTISISSTSPNVDVDFQVLKDGQRLFTAETATNSLETLTATLTNSEHILVIYDYNKAWPGDVCYSVSIQ